MDSRKGFALTFVLTIILALTILFACLLRIPGSVSRHTGRFAREVQAVYDAESAVIANLDGFDDNYFTGLPPVWAYSDGVWNHVCAPLRQDSSRQVPGGTAMKICAEYGTYYVKMRFDDWYSTMLAYRADFRERIAGARGFRVLSGSRRFFRLDSSVALHVTDGDLSLDLDTYVSSASFLVDGSVNVKGRAHFDTLRIYAEGEVVLGGDVSVGFLEVYSGASLEVHSSFRFSGLLFARNQVTIRERAYAEFPSVAVAMGSGDSRVSLSGRASFAGVLASPGGSVELDCADSLHGAAFPGGIRDTALSLLPAFFDGKPVVFRRSS